VHVRDNIEEFEKRNVTLVAISAEDPAILKKYLRFHKFPFTVVNDQDRKLIRQMGIAQDTDTFRGTIPLPVNIVIDPEGIMRFVYIGEPEDGNAEIEDMLKVIDEIGVK
jgi:peroxiredoxin